METSSSAKECGVCNQVYDEEEKCPRILPCTHCFCTECIDKLIKLNNKRCPFCRSPFHAWSASTFGRNTSLLELMKYTADLETKTIALQADKGSPHSKKLDELKSENEKLCCQNIDHLHTASEQIAGAILNNSTVIDEVTEEMSHIENDILGRVNVLLEGCYDKVKFLKIENHTLSTKLVDIESNQKKMEAVKDKFAASQSFKEVGKVIDIAEKANSSVQTWLQDFRKVISNDEKERQEIRKSLHETKGQLTIVHEFLNSLVDLRATMISISVPGVTHEYISLSSLKERKPLVMSLVKKGKVYAIQRLYGIRRSARITLSDENELCLHHLKEGPPPSDAHVIEHRDVTALVDQSSRTAFLEFTAGKSVCGRLLIRLTPNTSLSSQFFTLCTGEKGHSFSNTNILSVKNKGTEKEIIHCGDYENNNNTGGKTLRAGMKKEDGGLCRMWEAGALDGVWVSDVLTAKFDICTKTRPKKMLYASFGIVEKGLHTLTKVLSRHPNLSEVQFNDCGIVLS